MWSQMGESTASGMSLRQLPPVWLPEILISRTPGMDVYIETACLVYKKSIEKKDPLRDKCKTIFLGLDYGMTSFGLAARLSITEREAQEELDNFFGVFY